MTARRLANVVPNEARKQDARAKIGLGGLVVKAGLRDADKAFLLGVLIAAARVAPDSADYARIKAIGEAAFAEDKALPAGAESVQVAQPTAPTREVV